MIFWAEIHEDGLHPLHPSDSENLAKLKLHTEYKFVVTKPRNVGHHRKLFALLNMAFENQEKFNNIDDMRLYFQMKAGYYKRIDTGDGEMILPESISFSSMDQLAFEEFYSKILDVVCSWLNITNEEVMQNLTDFF